MQRHAKNAQQSQRFNTHLGAMMYQGNKKLHISPEMAWMFAWGKCFAHIGSFIHPAWHCVCEPMKY